MAKFVFQLEGVLRHRKNTEQMRQRDVARVQAEMTTLEARLAALELEVRRTNDDVRQNRLTGSVDVAFLTAHRRFLLATERQALEIAQQMGLVKVRLDAARRALSEAAIERKVLEKLRERQQETWQTEQNRKQAAALDEVVTQMTYRKLLEASMLEGESR